MTKKNTTKAVIFNVAAGFQLGVTIFIFVYAGYKIDEYFLKTPVYTIIGAVVGFIAGLYNLISELSRVSKMEKANSEKKQPDKWL